MKKKAPKLYVKATRGMFGGKDYELFDSRKAATERHGYGEISTFCSSEFERLTGRKLEISEIAPLYVRVGRASKPKKKAAAKRVRR